MKKSILVIAAHPDDEILGCGGSIARHVDRGDVVNVMILGEGITSRSKSANIKENEKELAILKSTASDANKILGVNSVELFGLPDNRLDSLDLLEIIKIIEEKILKHNPNIIYTHHGGDLNIDHQIVFKAVITASRPYPNQIVDEIYSFEVRSSTDWSNTGIHDSFAPNKFVNIQNTLDRKLNALNKYDMEMRDWPHARSYDGIEALAKYRGSSVGLDACEAFMIIRMVNK